METKKRVGDIYDNLERSKKLAGWINLVSPPCQAKMATQKIKFMQMLVTDEPCWEHGVESQTQVRRIKLKDGKVTRERRRRPSCDGSDV